MCHKLLIVEDDASLQQILSWDFEDLGYLVTAVSNCLEARQILAREPFDLALLDYHLPDGNGLQLVEELRRNYPNMPVIMSSGLSCAETASRAVDHGAFRFVPKPTTAEVLHRVFQTALGPTKTTKVD